MKAISVWQGSTGEARSSFRDGKKSKELSSVQIKLNLQNFPIMQINMNDKPIFNYVFCCSYEVLQKQHFIILYSSVRYSNNDFAQLNNRSNLEILFSLKVYGFSESTKWAEFKTNELSGLRFTVTFIMR